jgi:hypothetical protein
MALALADLGARLGSAAGAALGLALAGFGVHAAFVHGAPGHPLEHKPRYEPDVTREAGVTHGLLFFDDDVGFQLALDPAVPPSHGVAAVRLRGDDHDRLAYDTLGHPAIHRYTIGKDGANVVFWSPISGGDSWRFETENDWPPLAQSRGWTEAIDATTTCASEGRALGLTPDGDGEAQATIELPLPRGPTPGERRAWTITPRVLQRGSGGTATLALVAEAAGPALAQWSWTDVASSAGSSTCVDLAVQTVELGGDRPRAWLVLGARGGAVAVDKTTLRSSPTPAAR